MLSLGQADDPEISRVTEMNRKKITDFNVKMPGGYSFSIFNSKLAMNCNAMLMARLTLSEIWIYPIKSLGGIRLSSTKVLPKGLQYDRRWMLIDEAGVFITQRVHASMAFFKLSLVDELIIIQYKEDSIQLSVNAPIATAPITATIWDDSVEVHEVHGEYSHWFSQRLGMNCRLVYFPEENQRLVDEKYSLESDQVSLADGYPFLIIGQSSLNDLNSRLNDPVPMNRFRPNFVFTGGAPFEEDGWKTFSIGQNRFAGVKPCARCVLTTVNQETAERGKEPLATLATFRSSNNKINFGQNLLAIDNYEIHEGDRIELES